MNISKKNTSDKKLFKKIDKILENNDLSESDYNSIKELSEKAETSQNELERTRRELEERAKELNCLHDIARIIEKPRITTDEMMSEVLDLLPPAFQYPEITCARITFGEKEFKTKKFNVTPWNLTAGIYIRKKRKGKIEVFYLKEKPPIDAGPFLKEEKNLLFTIAREVGHFVEQDETRKTLHERRASLVRAQRIARMGNFIWNVKTGSVYWSEVMFELLGYEKHEVFDYARVNKEVHHPDDLNWVINWLQKCLESGEVEHEPMEYRLIRKDGKVIYVQTHVSVRYENKKAVELFGTVQDITTRKEAEKQRLIIEEELKKQNEEYLMLNEEYKATNDELFSEKEKLEESEEKFKNLFSSIKDAIVVTDFNRKIIQVNPSFTTLFGYSEQEILGQDTSILYESTDTYKATGKKIIENSSQAGVTLTIRARRKNGETFPGETSFFNLKSSKGEPEGFIGVIKDVTEEYEIRKALEQNEERLNVASENIDGILYALDYELKITLLKGKKLNVLGLRTDEMVGHPIYDFFAAGNNAGEMIELHRKCLAGETVKVESELDGFVFSTVISPLRNGAGNIIGVLGLATDTTEFKQTENKLKRTQFGIDNSKIGVLIVEDDGTISYANKHVCENLGYSPDELTGMSLFKIDKSFNAENFKKHREIAREQGKIKIVSTHTRKDDSVFPVEVTANYLEFGGKIVSFSFITDITERITAEETLKASEEKYRAVFENTGTATIIIENDGTISLANKQFSELAGIPLDEIQNKKTWMEFVVKEDLERMKTQHELRRISRESALHQYDFRFIDSKNQIKFIHLQVDIIPGTDKSVASMLDITHQREITKKIQERERQLFTLMSNLPGMAYRCRNDKYWTMEFVSSGCQQLTGYTTDELIGNSILSFGELIHESDWKKVWDAVQETQLNDESFVVEYRIRDKYGKLHWVWEQGKMVERSMDGRGYIEGFIMDITERKQAEEELKELKNELESRVEEKTHELSDRIRELERFHEATIEREFRIKELRDEIERLKENQ